MKKEILTVQEAFHQGRTLPFAMVRSLSAVTIGRTPVEVLEGELLEARFFDDQREIRVFRIGNDLHAALLQCEDGDAAYTETYQLKNPKLFGESITVRYELDADEDGQTYIAAVRLIDWKEERKNV